MGARIDFLVSHDAALQLGCFDGSEQEDQPDYFLEQVGPGAAEWRSWPSSGCGGLHQFDGSGLAGTGFGPAGLWARRSPLLFTPQLGSRLLKARYKPHVDPPRALMEATLDWFSVKPYENAPFVPFWWQEGTVRCGDPAGAD